MTVPLWPSEKWKGAVALDGFETDGSIIELIARGKTVVRGRVVFVYTDFQAILRKGFVWSVAVRATMTSVHQQLMTFSSPAYPLGFLGARA